MRSSAERSERKKIRHYSKINNRQELMFVGGFIEFAYETQRWRLWNYRQIIPKRISSVRREIDPGRWIFLGEKYNDKHNAVR